MSGAARLPGLSLERVANAAAETLARVQAILEGTEDFQRLCSGHAATPGEAARQLADVPASRSVDDVRVWMIRRGGHDTGCVLALDGYPDAHTIYLGLMLLLPAERGTGTGSAAFALFREQVAKEGWRRIRLSVLSRNPRGHAFWLRCGFVDTGLRRPWAEGTVRDEVAILDLTLRG